MILWQSVKSAEVFPASVACERYHLELGAPFHGAVASVHLCGLVGTPSVDVGIDAGVCVFACLDYDHLGAERACYCGVYCSGIGHFAVVVVSVFGTEVMLAINALDGFEFDKAAHFARLPQVH